MMYVCALWTDSSFDGICYHQEQVALIYNGWNPCLRPLEPEVSAVWVNHYPIGLEAIGAAIMGMTGHLQSAKAIMPVMAVMTFLLCRGLLSQVIPDTKNRTLTWIAVLITINPVVVAQLPTSYIDGTVSEYIVITILLALAIVVNSKKNWLNYLLIAAIITISVATKFNALLYEIITAALLFLGFLIFGYLKKSGQFYLLSLLFGTAAVFLFSYYPYVTNWITAGHPLYPLAGDNPIDIITEATAETFGQDSNRFTNFFRSIYSINLRAGAGSGVMGFSISFIILFPASILIIVLDAIKRHKFTPELYSLICLISVCFIFKACWWARYIPHLWLIVPLAYYTINRENNKHSRIISITINALAIAGVSIIVIYSIFSNMRYSCHRNAVYSALKGDTIPMTGGYMQFQRLMDEHHIKIIPLDFFLKPNVILMNPNNVT